MRDRDGPRNSLDGTDAMLSAGRSPGRPLLLSFATVIALALAALPASTFAQAAKPVKKDSSARTKPKDVTFSTAVVPIEAKPGESVVFKVTAKLNPGWHIYTYATQQQGEGPRNTKFDFFDPAGLEIDGTWSASKAPIRKKEPAFPDIDAVSFFEEEVTWSVTLKVPAGVSPGKKLLRCQASYQICDAKSCSFPGQWTLPEAELTILSASAGQAKADGAKPKQKDSPSALKPPGVVLTPSIAPTEARAGETVIYQIRAKLEPGWHIYDYAPAQPPSGPSVTQFDVFETSGLVVAGDWSSSRPPTLKEEPAFDNALVATFEGDVSWNVLLKVPDNTKPGPKTLRCQAAYQICDANICRPPGRWTLPEVVLTVLPGLPVGDVSSAPPTTQTAEKPAAPAPDRAVSEVEKTAQQGIIPLMVASALGGLLALVMPCVWPMVPITVNFFVKQGEKNKGKATGLAITYCLAIIGVFTAVGVLCSFFLSATALPKLANNPWLNFAVAGLFLAFGLSLLGLFEISLPTALLTASAKGESRGGLLGVVFMALTLTITSFTCTFPVVGGLLVMASTGQFFYPIIGLATFATVLALPFFLLALSPGMLAKMPRSGDWMNSVKIIGGLVEIGAAFKFLNTAELSFVTPENAFFNAQLILTAWVVLSAVCGFYLLGFFRTDHDYEEIKVGPGRIVLGTSFLGLALYLAPALFGRPPQGMIWDRLVIGLLPPDATALTASSGAAGKAETEQAEHATSADPKLAERQEKRFHGVWWGFSYEAALEKAKAEKKPVLIDFTGVNCANCRLMESRVLPRPDVVKVLKDYVTVQLYTPPGVPISSLSPDQREALGEKNAELQLELTSDNTNPFYVVLSPEGKVLGTTGGYREPAVFLAFLNKGLAKHSGTNKVAQANEGR